MDLNFTDLILMDLNLIDMDLIDLDLMDLNLMYLNLTDYFLLSTTLQTVFSLILIITLFTVKFYEHQTALNGEM